MKKLLTIISLVAVCLLAGVGIAYSQSSSFPNYFKKTGTNISFLNSTWTFGTVTYPIANGYFTALTAGTLNFGGVATGAIDLNGYCLILDADGNSSLCADTNDQIDVEIGGEDDFKFTANKFTALSGSTIQIPSNTYLLATDNAGTGTVNMFKTNASDEIEIGAILNVGTYQVDTNAGAVSFLDFPVTSASGAGTEQSLSLAIDSANVIKLYSESNGSGGIQNAKIINYYNTEIGNAVAGTDYTLTFNGESDDAVITYMEDENYLGLADTGIVTTGSVDFGAGSFEIPNGTTIPATCTVGQMFDDTDSNDCANTGGGDGALCICKSTNTWALISNF